MRPPHLGKVLGDGVLHVSRHLQVHADLHQLILACAITTPHPVSTTSGATSAGTARRQGAAGTRTRRKTNGRGESAVICALAALAGTGGAPGRIQVASGDRRRTGEDTGG
eukprot:1189649-Prorocentrum_minimum.AAC.1